MSQLTKSRRVLLIGLVASVWLAERKALTVEIRAWLIQQTLLRLLANMDSNRAMFLKGGQQLISGFEKQPGEPLNTGIT